ncbi:aldehyde dehydrogenase (NAD+) [Fusarium circinatum]|uniref:Aldehyde dehydrogenase (NAD+) n=1 Tax=Fusarium circinatum TaxID=48490 RepID=A0A8H5X5B7_FUSCI|nr:aldehyde dehydrogenase (NAD+) [Fusarium circinatum]
MLGSVKELIEGFQNTLIQKFINSNATKPGVPTPDNPFVLGYSVSQEKADLATVNPAAAKANLPTPDFFVPKSFRCNLSPLSSFCQGTLNYCMLTHRAKKPPYHKENGLERIVDYGIDGAGRFKENVFSRMKTRATLLIRTDQTETKNWADSFTGAFEGELAGLVKVGEGAAANGEKVFKGALDDLANSLGATVILPAGDVFMFKGMSCDENYNVFTTICYDTPTSGKVTAHASSDMSHTAWQKPQPPT